MIKNLILIFFILTSKVAAQEIKLGFRYEPFLYAGGYNIDRPEKDNVDIFFTSLYLTSSLTVDDFYKAQIRLGYLATKSKSYNGLDATTLLLLNYKSGFSPSVGLNFHKNVDFEDSFLKVKNMIMVSPLVGFEIGLGNNWQSGISIQFPINNQFLESYNLKYHARYLLKFSIGWEFKL